MSAARACRPAVWLFVRYVSFSVPLSGVRQAGAGCWLCPLGHRPCDLTRHATLPCLAQPPLTLCCVLSCADVQSVASLLPLVPPTAPECPVLLLGALGPLSNAGPSICVCAIVSYVLDPASTLLPVCPAVVLLCEAPRGGLLAQLLSVPVLSVCPCPCPCPAPRPSRFIMWSTTMMCAIRVPASRASACRPRPSVCLVPGHDVCCETVLLLPVVVARYPRRPEDGMIVGVTPKKLFIGQVLCTAPAAAVVLVP